MPDTTPKPITREDIAEAVARLLVNGQGRKATRLVLVDESQLGRGAYAQVSPMGCDLGGYCEGAVIDRLCEAMGIE